MLVNRNQIQLLQQLQYKWARPNYAQILLQGQLQQRGMGEELLRAFSFAIST